jgi:hypothetical protein
VVAVGDEFAGAGGLGGGGFEFVLCEAWGHGGVIGDCSGKG